MATGNLGDLEMSLTLKSRVEDEVKGIVRSMNSLDASGKRAQEAIDAISSAFKSMHKGTAEVTKLSAVLEKLNAEIDLERSMEFPSQKTLTKLNKVTEGLSRVKDILGQMSRDEANGFNIFPNGISSEVNAAQKAMNKLSGIAIELNNWEGKGLQLFDVKNTDNIRQASSELSKYRSILEQIRNNGGTHPITGLTASDITKSAEYIAALDKAKASAKEVKQAIADANLDAKISADIEKERQQLMAKEAAEKEIINKKEQEYQLRQQAILDLEKQVTEEKRKQAEKNKATDRKIDLSIEKERQQLEDEYLSKLSKEGVIAQQNAETQRRLLEQQRDMQGRIAQENAKSEIKWNEQLTKARTDALKKQMEADVAAEKNARVLLSSNGFDVSTFEKRVAMLNRMKDIQEKLAYYQPKVQYAWLDYETSLKPGNANTSALRHKEDELQRLRTLIADLESEFNKLGGNKVFADVDNQIKSLEQTIERLKGAGTLNLGKMLGLENKSTDEFRIAKEAAMAAESHAKKQNELNTVFEKYFQEQERIKAAEERLASAMSKTNQARREAVAASRQQAEALVRDRIKELEAQQQQLKGLYSSKNGSLSEESLSKVKSAFSKITQEVNTLRSALNNLGSYSIDELFSRARKTSDLSPMIKAVELEKQHQREVAETAARVKNDLANAFSGVNREASKTSQILGDIKSLFLQGGIVFGAKQFFDSIVQTGGEIVQQHVALRSILGDVQKADELFAQTQQLALQSPFKFGELNRDVKQLAAFGVEANDLYDTTKRLADIASGLGVSFERLGLAYGQVKARSWLDGKELRQFAYAGLPLLQKIAELYNSTGKNGKTDYKAGDIKKMITNREVSFEDVQKVLWQMTDQGGQFYNMQLVLSDTLLGRWNKLIDAWDIMVGKMAEGKSVVGGTFSFFINRVTDLVLALDKMQPALLAFGAMFALKKGASAIGSKIGIGTNLAALQAEQQTLLRTYAVEQQKLLIEGKITQQKMQQNIADYQGFLNSKMNTRNAVEQAALEGRLSALKLQKAYAEKLISPELVKQLELMGVISAKQSELIVKSGNWAKAQLAAQGAMSKIGGFFSGWNLATIGVTIAGALYSAWSSFNSKIKQDTETTANNAKSTYESMANTLKEIGGKKGSGEALQEQIDKMTETLKQSNLYTDSIKEQIASTNDLGKEYDILKGKIEEAKKANDFTPGEANAYAKAKAATGAGFAGGGSWFGQLTGLGQDDIDENTDDVANALVSLQMKMEKFGNTTKATMEQVANSILGAKAAGMAFEEKMAEIYSQNGTNGYWDTFVKKVSGGSKDVEKDLKGLEGDLGHFGSNFKEITTDDIPKYLEEMAKSRNMSLNEFSQWCKKHPEKFGKMLDEMLSEANSKVPNLVARLQQVAKAILNIGNTEPKKQDNTPKVWKNPLKEGTIDRKAFNKLLNAGKLKGGKGGFWQKEMAALIYSLNNGQSTGWENFGSSVQKAYKEARNENDAAKAAGEKAPYARKQAMLETLANQLGITLDIGKNKVTGNYGKGGRSNKQDKELEYWKERYNSYRDARSTYEKRKGQYGPEEAAEYVNKVYSNVAGLDMGNYVGGLTKLRSEVKPTTSARRNFINQLTKEIEDFKLSDILKPEMQRVAQDLKEALEDGISQYQLYKELLGKTGDKVYASKAFKNGVVWNDITRNMKQEFEERFGVKFDENASDATAEKYLKDNLGDIGESAFDMWKNISNLIHNDYTDALKDGADMLAENVDYANQLAIILDKYKDKISVAKQTGDENLVNALLTSQRKEVGKVTYDKFTNSSSYVRFFATSIKQGSEYLKKFANIVRKQLKEALDAGAISAEEYAEGLEKLSERMANMGSGSNISNFLSGGLSGMVNGMKDRGKTQMSQGANMYKTAKSLYDKLSNSGKGNTAEAITAQDDMKAGESMMNGGAELMQGASEMEGSIGIIDKIINGINDTVQGMYNTFQDIKETAEALGTDTSSDDWQDANTFLSSFSSASQSATDGWNSLKEGNVGGVITGVVGSFTGWIKGFAQGHDSKLETQITIAERANKYLKNVSDNVATIVENTLGGIYSYKASDYTTEALQTIKSQYERRKALEAELNGTSTNTAQDTALGNLKGSVIGGALGGWIGAIGGGIVGTITGWLSSKSKKLKKEINKIPDYSDEVYNAVVEALNKGTAYHTQLASLIMQKDTLERQMKAEQDKKKSDDDKIADYKKQIEDTRLQIEEFSQTFLKEIYSVDIKSWASELTDAVVSAWSSGEDAVEAYRDKVKEIIKDLTKSIVSQKYVETALNKPLEYLTSLLTEKGQLDETDIDTLADMLYKVGDETVPQLTKIFEALKNRGWDLTENGSSSTTNSIKSITEETADLLCSYVNAIRLDVSVNRENIKLIAEAVADLPNLNVIAQSQLTSLNQLVNLAEARNSKLDDMYTWMRSVTSGTGTKSISIK